MKKVLSFLLTLVMCVSIMPSIASASSEAGSVREEYDPKTGYTTITTDDYTAIVPKGGEVVYPCGTRALAGRGYAAFRGSPPVRGGPASGSLDKVYPG